MRCGVAVSLMVVGAEIGLRLILGLGYPLLIRADPMYGYMPAPNQDLHGFFSHIHINAFGMRSDDIEATKPSDMRRILCGGLRLVRDYFGGSTTHFHQPNTKRSGRCRTANRGAECVRWRMGMANEQNGPSATGDLGHLAKACFLKLRVPHREHLVNNEN